MKVLLFCLLIAVCGQTSAQQMYMDDETTDVTFTTHHLAGRLAGTVKGVKGTLILDTTNLSAASLVLSFAPATFLHDDNYLGPDLFKQSCFDTKNHPEIRLSSTSIKKATGVGNYQFTGTLVVKDSANPVSFIFNVKANEGGYDLAFSFPIAKKAYQLHCAFAKKMMIKVSAYAKRKPAD